MEISVKKEPNLCIRFLLFIKKGWKILLIFSIIGALMGLLVAQLTYKDKYELLPLNDTVEMHFKLNAPEDFNYLEIISEENINRTKSLTKSLYTGGGISTYQYVEIEDINITKNGDEYIIVANQSAFNVGKDYSYNDTAAKGFLKHLAIISLITPDDVEGFTNSGDLKHPVVDNFDTEYYESHLVDNKLKINIADTDAYNLNEIAKANNNNYKMNYFIIFALSFTFGLAICCLIVYFILAIKNNIPLDIKHEYDNVLIFRTPFHIRFFSSSLAYFKDLRALVTIAILLGMVMVCKFIPIPSGFGNLGLSFSYLFLAIACMLYGPIPALMIGFLSDTVGYLIRPDGIFFPGYTIQSMFACFCYALCFYKTHITFTRCLVARILVNFIANIVIGTISWSIMNSLTMEATISFLLIQELPKNIIYLLPQSLLLFIVIKAVSKPLGALSVIDKNIADNVSFF